MTVSPFTIAPIASLTLEPGREGKLSFSVTSLAAPDEVHEVSFQALLVDDSGKGKEVDWLVAGPQRTMSLSGGKTETVTITARPTTTTPLGKYLIKLALAGKEHLSEVLGESPAVTCEVSSPSMVALRALAATGAPQSATVRLPTWLIPAIAGGVLVVGVAILGIWKLLSTTSAPASPPVTHHLLGAPCGSAPANSCDPGLVCVAGVQKCLLVAGASCKPAQAALCASGECDGKTEVCALSLGDACATGDSPARCPKLSTCDPATKICVKNTTSGTCEPGVQQCSSNGTELRLCGDNGTWKTEACPASAPSCRGGKCQCVANKGKPCNCGGIVQCGGTCSTAACTGSCVSGRCCMFSGDPACGSVPVRRLDFNSYILKAVELLYQQYGNQGYQAGTAYTHNLDYSTPGEIKRGPKWPATMCVAAVSEVIVVALKLYADEHHDTSVFTRLPAISWMRGSAVDIRSYMFLYDNVDSNGTADALTHFGIGEHLSFPALVPGDFIGLNRENRSGHAVVFMGFLNASGQIEPKYDSKKVVGFKYFSSQGTAAPHGGFSYRWAFFGNCPNWREADKPRDCGIVLSDNQKILNTGYMLYPTQWTTEPAMTTLRSALIQKNSVKLLTKRLGRLPTHVDMRRMSPAETSQLQEQANRELSVELPATSRLVFDGKTTDD